MLSNSSIIITGDFNARTSKWLASDPDTIHGKRIGELVEQYNLDQLIREPTYFTDNMFSLLDLVITDSPQLIKKTGTLSQLTACRHCPITASISFSVPKSKAYPRTLWDYKHADLPSIIQNLNKIAWDDVLNCNNINESCKKLTSIISNISHTYIPNKRVIIRPNDKPWMNSYLRTLMRKRNRLFNKFNRTLNPQVWLEYKKLRNFIVNEIRKRKVDYFDSISAKLSTPGLCPKKWWRLAKALTFNKTAKSTPALIENGTSIMNDQKKAEIFNEYFTYQNSVDDSNAQLPAFFLPY